MLGSAASLTDDAGCWLFGGDSGRAVVNIWFSLTATLFDVDDLALEYCVDVGLGRCLPAVEILPSWVSRSGGERWADVEKRLLSGMDAVQELQDVNNTHSCNETRLKRTGRIKHWNGMCVAPTDHVSRSPSSAWRAALCALGGRRGGLSGLTAQGLARERQPVIQPGCWRIRMSAIAYAPASLLHIHALSCVHASDVPCRRTWPPAYIGPPIFAAQEPAGLPLHIGDSKCFSERSPLQREAACERSCPNGAMYAVALLALRSALCGSANLSKMAKSVNMHLKPPSSLTIDATLCRSSQNSPACICDVMPVRYGIGLEVGYASARVLPMACGPRMLSLPIWNEARPTRK